MRKGLLILLGISFGLLLVGCKKDDAAATNTPTSAPASAPAKGGDTQAMTGQVTPGPGAAEAESRMGSKADKGK